MDSTFGNAVIEPAGRPEARAAKALGVEIVGVAGERPVSHTWRATLLPEGEGDDMAPDRREVALVVVREDATADDRGRFADAAERLLGVPEDALSGVLRPRRVSPTRDAYIADLWTTGCAADLATLGWPLRRRLDFARRTAEAIEAIHRAGAVHGCLCVDNVLLDDDLNPVVSEAGAVSVHALIARNGDAASYAAWAAPEVNEGGEPSVRSDVFSLGRLIQHAVAGMDAPQVAEVVRRCLGAAPSGRYGSAAAVVAAIDEAIASLPAAGSAMGAPRAPRPKAPPSAERRPKPEAIGAEEPVATAPSPPARWPAPVGAIAVATAVALAFFVDGTSSRLRPALSLVVFAGAALATWVVPPTVRIRLASRAALALSFAILVAVIDPLGFAYRLAAERGVRGDVASRHAAIEAILKLGRDFRGLSLTGLDLAGLDLTGADLRGVDLSRADLSRSRLWGALLDGASLDQTRIHGADLQQTDLSFALHVESVECDGATRLPSPWRCTGGRLMR